MSMPAMAGDRVYQVYPDSRGDRRHYLAAFDLITGRQLWKQPLPGDIITAPVLAEGYVYVANLDGTLSCFRQDDGAKVWQEAKSATSSPMVSAAAVSDPPSQTTRVPLAVARHSQSPGT